MARWKHLLHSERMVCAVDGSALVATAALLPFELTVPGNQLPAAGVSLVSVLPTHRRRGILRAMMRVLSDDARRRGEPLALLYASEASIYTRFGYGLASFDGRIDCERDRAILREGPPPMGQTRLVTPEQAAATLAPIYDRVRVGRPGMLTRTPAWWVHHRLYDNPADRRGAGPLRCAVWEHGAEAAYALYRVNPAWEEGTPASTLEVLETVATSSVGHREIWRFLFGVDLIKTIKAWLLPADHPLPLLVAEPRRLKFTLSDALWLQLVDLPAALAARTYAAADTVVFEVRDSFCSWNAGAWRLVAGHHGATIEKTSHPADLRLDVERLASTYLGGISFKRLSEAGFVDELTPGAIGRADTLFRTDQEPWCAEIF